MKFCTTSSISIFHPNFSRSAWNLGNWFLLKRGFHSSSATLSSYIIKLKIKGRAFLCCLCAVIHKSILGKTKTADLNCRLVDVLSHFLLLLCLPRGSFCLQHPADVLPWVTGAGSRGIRYREWCLCSHTCCKHTRIDCLCLPSPKPFSFRTFSIPWNLFWLGPWLFPPLFLWCFMFFSLTYTQTCTNQ